jgi:hypothetical protein
MVGGSPGNVPRHPSVLSQKFASQFPGSGALESVLTEAPNAGEDLIRALGPGERPWALIGVLQEASHVALELTGAAMRSPLDLSLREDSKLALDEVEPGVVGRCEVNVESRALSQPPLNGRRLVSCVVVEDEVDVELVRDLVIDRPEEAEELSTANDAGSTGQ